MKKLGLLALICVSCAYPKGPINVAGDRVGIEREGWVLRAVFAPMSICVKHGDPYQDELVQLAHYGVNWWNSYLARPVGCNVFEVDTRNDTALFCDIIVQSGLLRPGVTGMNDGWWSRRSDPPGVFYKSEITLDAAQFARPDYHRGVMVHELGHSFGLADDDGGSMRQFGSVMASPLPRVYRPTNADLQFVIQNLQCDRDESSY